MHYSSNIQLYRKTTALPFHQGERKNIHIFLTVPYFPNNGNGQQKREGDKGTEYKQEIISVITRLFIFPNDYAPQINLISKITNIHPMKNVTLKKFLPFLNLIVKSLVVFMSTF